MILQLQHGKTIRVTDSGWQHIWNMTHYRISARVARRLRPADIPPTITLWVGTAGRMDCPHCEGSTARQVLWSAPG